MAQLEEKVEFLEKKVAALEARIEETFLAKEEKNYSVAQVATLLGLKSCGVNYHIRSGNLIASGKRYKKIKESDLNRFIELNKKYEVKA